MRCGIGYDVHPFFCGRRLILGGVSIPYERGLAGHSDADVLSHSIADALLGACGERDLGCHFPDTESQYEGICSLRLLEEISKILRNNQATIVNVDSTLIAQEPVLGPYVPQMKGNIARALQIKTEQVGIKVTSPEGLGYLGEKKGIACLSVAAIDKMPVS